MNTFTATDGTELYFKDWGTGPAIIFSHGWPLNSDSWEAQMYYLASRGFRCIAHDRRGHGRSEQTWDGNDMDTYADDLDALIETLELDKITLVGFSAGGGEVARYIGRHGTSKVIKLVFISSVTPYMLQTPANPDGVPMKVFDELREKSLRNRSQFYEDTASGPFYGFNRMFHKSSQGFIDGFWLQAMTASHKSAHDCIRAFSETDFTDDLMKIDVPTLIIQGDDDQMVPLEVSGQKTAELVKNSRLIIYPGGPHGLADTFREKLNEDLLEFIRG